MKQKRITWLALLLVPCFSADLISDDVLWGEGGSLWEPGSVLPDFSFAGYHQGEKEIPDPEPEVSVLEYGAVGDGETDCTEAFLSAISESAGKVIGIPEGVYLISDRLHLSSPNTVLKGEGPEKTILFFQRGLQEIEPTSALTGGGFETNSWSWSGGIITVGGSLGDVPPKTVIAEPAKRGERVLTVENADNLNTDDVYQIRMDDSTDSLLNHLYRDQPGDLSLISEKRFEISQLVKIVKIEGTQVTLNRSLRFDLRPEWSPLLLRKTIAAQENGISDLTIRFPEREYRGHWMEDGMNGIQMQGINNWVRNIRIENCDSGVFVKGFWNSIDGLIIETNRQEHDSGNTGHHGITIQGGDCLVTNFNIATRFFHDVTVSQGSTGNVFSRGEAVDLSIDHHRYAPYENLFTQIDAGKGSRIWNSGGTRGKGSHTASGATFWNIDSKDRFELPEPDFGPPGLVFAGVNTGNVRSSELPEGWHFDDRKPGRIQPENLHLAQLARRLETSESAPATTSTTREYLPWTNREGNTIEAAFLGVSGSALTLERRDGETFEYPISKLDEASKAKAKALWEAAKIE